MIKGTPFNIKPCKVDGFPWAKNFVLRRRKLPNDAGAGVTSSPNEVTQDLIIEGYGPRDELVAVSYSFPDGQTHRFSLADDMTLLFVFGNEDVDTQLMIDLVFIPEILGERYRLDPGVGQQRAYS